MQRVRGVESVVSGYAGGSVENPTYEQICSGTTGHAEVVQVGFDPEVIAYDDLLEIFFHTHDPTTLNRQGADVGTQYRSVIFTHGPEQQEVALAKKTEVDASDLWPNPIVTEITPLETFYSAEGYHQNYYNAHSAQPYCMAVIDPKVRKFMREFGEKLKEGEPGK